jgi:hypothetical protein
MTHEEPQDDELLCANTISRRKSNYGTPLHKTEIAHTTHHTTNHKAHVCVSIRHLGARAAATGRQPALGKRAHLALPRRFHDFEGEKNRCTSKHLCRGASIAENLDNEAKAEDTDSAVRSRCHTLKSVPWKSLTMKYR